MAKKRAKGFTITNKLIPIFFLLLTFSCREDNPQNAELRDILVEFQVSVDLQDPNYQQLLFPDQFKYVDGGREGLVLISNNQGEIKAFERNCSFQPLSECAKITMHPSLTFFWDSCCSSQFFLTGEVKEGPANKPMVQYRSEFQGNVLWISYP